MDEIRRNVIRFLTDYGFQIIGAVGGEELELEGQLKLPLSALREARERGLPQWL